MQLSEKHGLFAATIWNDPANAGLREKRANMNVLHPGDEVFIPERRPGTVSVATGRRHVFKRRGTPALLRFKVLQNGAPRAEQRYVVTIDGREMEGTTSAQGVLEQWIPPGSANGSIVIGPDRYHFTFRIGHLNPVSEISGVAARLQNLGFLRKRGASDAVIAEAVRAFQAAHALPSTGELDDATRAKLLAVHDGRSTA